METKQRARKVYWRRFQEGVQRSLRALSVTGAVPSVDMPKPNKTVRAFLTKVERRLKALGIKLRFADTILSTILAGLDVAGKDKNTRATWLLKLMKDLGVEMSVGEALEILDGFESMENYLRHQLTRNFRDHFGTTKIQMPKVEDPEDEEEEDDEDEENAGEHQVGVEGDEEEDEDDSE